MNTEAIRDRLVARQKVLLERANKVERDASHRDAPLSADFAEQATERENDDVLLALGDEWHHELQDIDHALDKLEHGTYGECDTCGESINAARLEAIPTAHQCMMCAD
ncbi:TraR/DksA family transcriptional regulator [Thalassolituus sp.]|jgi:RNA polymerase-binding protein DksA|uniref:TraR/DksA family transcriptional regulator n=1 Tax=Thalassolituus sp. TaxID=2030822 RepID=UPI002A808989|nr:TraR/DksA family transcriptional regulator [Thalassolituus sp.]